MKTQTAKVIPWNGAAASTAKATAPEMTAMNDLLIMVEDDQLDAMAATFMMSPLRRAMTFEAYLAVKGFARNLQ